MNMSAVEYPPFKYSIHLPFAARPITPEWLGSKFLETLDALTQIDSRIFPDWDVGDLSVTKGYSLAAARPRIAEIIGHNLARDEFGQPEPESGYTAVAVTKIGERSHRMKFCARTWLGEVWLKAGDWNVEPDPAIVTFPLFKAASLAMTAIWQVPWACAQAFRSASVKIPLEGSSIEHGYSLKRLPMVPADPTFPKSIFHIPWFAYLSAPLAAGVKPPPEIQTERVADGGLLMVATKERLDPDMLDHARRARILAETLIAQTGNPGATKK